MADYHYTPPPLQKIRKDGTLYTRLPKTEKLLQEFSKFSTEQIVELARNKNRKSPDYVPSEVLVHRLRMTISHKSDVEFGLIYSLLEDRIRRVCPRKEVSTASGAGEVGILADLQENVLERFLMLILPERKSYQDKLDIFEVVFDRAVAKLRADAGRQVYGKAGPLTALEYDETGDIPTEIEESLDLYHPQNMTPEEEITYRFQIRGAIDSLPENERRIIDMQLAGIPDQSNDPDTTSISQSLGCTDKTVRNRRKRAIAHLRQNLEIESDK